MKHICPNKHTSYSLLKTQIEYACVSHVNFKITYYQLLNWVGGERKRDMIKRKEPRSSAASPSTATMVTTVVFPITHDLQERETLFSTFIFVSMEICYFSPICWFVPFFFWDLVDFKLSGLILSSLLASCILGFHQRSCAHNMFAILLCEIVSTTLHVILIFYFIFTIFLTGLAWIMWSGFSLLLYFSSNIIIMQ